MSIKGEGRLPPLQTKKRRVVFDVVPLGRWWMLIFGVVGGDLCMCTTPKVFFFGSSCNIFVIESKLSLFQNPDLSFQSIPVVLSWQLGEPSCPRSHPFLDCLSASPEIISSFNRRGKKFPVALYEKGLLKHSKHCQGHNWDMDWVFFLFWVF